MCVESVERCGVGVDREGRGRGTFVGAVVGASFQHPQGATDEVRGQQQIVVVVGHSGLTNKGEREGGGERCMGGREGGERDMVGREG